MTSSISGVTFVANVKAVQRMAGPAKASMTLDTYAALFDEDLDDVADRLNAAIRTTADDRYGVSICNALTCETCGAKGNRNPSR
jgi:hypothetical protein